MNTYRLPKTIDVPMPGTRALDLSKIYYAVVSGTPMSAFALFKWRDRAEDYRKRYGGTIVHIETGNIS